MNYRDKAPEWDGLRQIAHSVAKGECKKHDHIFNADEGPVCSRFKNKFKNLSGPAPRTHSVYSTDVGQGAPHQSLLKKTHGNVHPDSFQHTQTSTASHSRVQRVSSRTNLGGGETARPSSAGHGHQQHETFNVGGHSHRMPELGRGNSVDQFVPMPGSFPRT